MNINKVFKLYDDRLINSIYFDNDKFEIYNDSVEGISPRKKIRLRFYGDKNQFDKQKEILLEKNLQIYWEIKNIKKD